MPATFLFSVDERPKAASADYVPPRGYVCYRATTQPVIDGKMRICFAQTEPDAGSDLGLLAGRHIGHHDSPNEI
jgi:hypothetical protein